MPAPQLRAVSAVEPDATRARLHEAIAKVAAAQAAIATAEQARGRVHAGFLAALRSQDTAKDRLRAAEADGHRHRVATLLGEETGAQPTNELRRAVELAEIAVASAKEDEALLDAEIARRRQQLDFAIIARDGAVSDVLRPTAAVLLQRIQDAQATAAGLRGALALFPPDSLPAYWNAETRYPEDAALSMRWRDVVSSLSTDPDAPIPEGDLT
jgi:hypothetical protein